MAVKGTGRSIVKTINKRIEILDSIFESPKTKPELVDDIGTSRSTIDRGISSLEEHGCVTRTNEGMYRLTTKGELLLREHSYYFDSVARIEEADTLLSYLDGAEVSTEFIRGMDVYSGCSRVPEAAVEPAVEVLSDATRLIGLFKAASTYYLRVLNHQIEQHDLTVEMVAHREVMDTLTSVAEDETRSLIASDSTTIYTTTESVPLSVWVVETGDGEYAGITVHNQGATRGVLINDTEHAVEWALTKCSTYKRSASKLEQ